MVRSESKPIDRWQWHIWI